MQKTLRSYHGQKCTERHNLRHRITNPYRPATQALLEQETIPGEAVQQAIAPLLDTLPQRPSTHAPHLERVAASDYPGFDPMYDLAPSEDEALDSAPGMA